MIEKYENIIRKLILRKYPVITDVKVKDRFEKWGYPFEGSSFYVLYKTDECLTYKLSQKIDNETQLIIRYFPKEDFSNVPGGVHEAKCYFDCGNGYEFNQEYRKGLGI
jgi:hypothetical protein